MGVVFEVEVNGERVGAARLEECGIMTANIDYLRRTVESYNRAKAEAPDDWDTSLEEWIAESISVGCRSDQGSSAGFSRALNVGDEVTIRIVGDVEPDVPK